MTYKILRHKDFTDELNDLSPANQREVSKSSS